jgi:hypothetical protein
MRRLLLLLVLVVAVVVGVGFYQGWFRVSTGETNGTSSIPVTVDREKMEQDKERAKDKLQDLKQKVREKTDAGPHRSSKGTDQR